LRHKGKAYFENVFLKYLSPISVIALLTTLVLLFAFKGDLIVRNPLHILLIAVPLFIQTNFIFLISYVAAQKLGMFYEDAAPAALIGASNHFRGCDRHCRHPLRPQLRGRPGHRRRGADRSPRHADAGGSLQKDGLLVSP
jgi:hypothetical protein